MIKKMRLGGPVVFFLLALSLMPAGAAERDSSIKDNRMETRTMDEIYKAAVREGGKLVVYAGGDIGNAYAETEKAFKERFPLIDIHIFTDLSKYHDNRIDLQLALGNLECDVAHLQTLHDFDRWKREGVLEPYFPHGWEAVYPEFKDPDGAFTAITLFSFSNVVGASVADDAAPREARDYLKPAFKGKLVMTYPHDDDAVLFQFDQIVNKYGWGYIDSLLRQDVQWIRGTTAARDVVRSGAKVATFTAAGALASDGVDKFLLPKSDSFLTWPQTAAIFRAAKHKEAARLYLNWLLEPETIKAMPFQWTVRRDVANPGGYDSVYAYNTDLSAFRRFMSDRGNVERLKGKFEQLIGPVVGETPTGTKGLYLVR